MQSAQYEPGKLYSFSTPIRAQSTTCAAEPSHTWPWRKFGWGECLGKIATNEQVSFVFRGKPVGGKSNRYFVVEQ
jgi:hypothetical protein